VSEGNRSPVDREWWTEERRAAHSARLKNPQYWTPERRQAAKQRLIGNTTEFWTAERRAAKSEAMRRFHAERRRQAAEGPG
jgi:hypothetical protein